MKNLDSALAQQAQTRPQEVFRVLVRVQGDLDARQGQLEVCDFTVTRRLRLIHGFAASAKGETLLRATEEDWIISIEPDAQVHTM